MAKNDNIFAVQLNKRQTAQLLGVTPVWFGKLIRDYGFPDKTTYTPQESVKAYVNILKKNDTNATTAELKVRHLEAKTRLMELELAHEDGSSVPIEDVMLVITEALTTAKSRLTSLPSRCAVQLTDAKTSAEIEHTLKIVVNEALEELAVIPEHLKSLHEQPLPQKDN